LITDANNCTHTGAAIISQPAVLSSTVSASNVPCNGGANGSASLTSSGGTTPYTYSWSSGQTTSSVTNFTAGDYSVTLHDAHSCLITQTVTVAEPATALTNSMVILEPSCGNANGNIKSIPNGGTGPYTYSWNTGNSTNSVTGLTGLPTQTLIVTVTDFNGCIFKDTSFVNCLITAITDLDSLNVMIYPNPANTWLEIQRESSDELFLEIFSVIGEKLCSSVDNSTRMRIDLRDMQPGIYFLHVTSVNGASVKKVIISH
jgi:hypothetical protein